MTVSEELQVRKHPITDPDKARDVLYRFLTEEAVRVRFATRNREAMHAAIQRGEEPEGHRVDWVVAASNALVDVLMAAAQSFNEVYPYDTILLGDFLDVVATTRGRLIKASGATEVPPKG
jgi:hypothetical protein